MIFEVIDIKNFLIFIFFRTMSYLLSLWDLFLFAFFTLLSCIWSIFCSFVVDGRFWSWNRFWGFRFVSFLTQSGWCSCLNNLFSIEFSTFSDSVVILCTVFIMIDILCTQFLQLKVTFLFWFLKRSLVFDLWVSRRLVLRNIRNIIVVFITGV